MTIKRYVHLFKNFLNNPKGPHHVQWLVTRRCNYRCKSCNVWRKQSKEEIGTEGVFYGLDKFRELGVKDVNFSGGNPLLRDDIGDILEYSSRYFVTTIYDNGSMVKEKIGALKHADYVAISLDSIDKGKQDYIKGVEGSLEKILEAIRVLKENKIKFALSTTISRLNIDEIPSIVRKFGGAGIPFNFSVYEYDQDLENASFSIGKEAEEFKIKNKKKIVDLCDEIESLSKDYRILIPNQCFKTLKKIEEGEKVECGALSTFFVVDHLGRVSGCHLKEPVTTIYNIDKFWNSKKAEKLRSEYKSCNECSYLCYIAYSLPISALAKPSLKELVISV